MSDQVGGWYSVRCIFRWTTWQDTPFEERILLWQAQSLRDAIALAESEAREYAQGNQVDYVGLAQAYALPTANEIGSGVEVFSLLRDSELPPDEYLSSYFDTGRERLGDLDPEDA
ncbi:hypothetical protein F0L68_02375 [Solihabitans fulvus]|uniref:DUF4288 domain-containing protein n=1 Tax=Solihabitans fulvus TaxID=1892852 RepID=A0A5B2XTB4_9PSEU|nr:hypothetical protein [Solihabitans fulvus]KAA2266603.1 hypothetical protein F0L68_02375 [Solihabitans fulvus]